MRRKNQSKQWQTLIKIILGKCLKKKGRTGVTKSSMRTWFSHKSLLVKEIALTQNLTTIMKATKFQVFPNSQGIDYPCKFIVFQLFVWKTIESINFQSSVERLRKLFTFVLWNSKIIKNTPIRMILCLYFNKLFCFCPRKGVPFVFWVCTGNCVQNSL